MERWAKIAPLSTVTSQTAAVSDEMNAVLRELVELLEDYAPIWYTEDLHQRAASALSVLHTAV